MFYTTEVALLEQSLRTCLKLKELRSSRLLAFSVRILQMPARLQMASIICFFITGKRNLEPGAFIKRIKSYLMGQL